MANEIEKMNRMRKNILRGVLIGSIIAFGVFMYPTFFFIFVSARPRVLSLFRRCTDFMASRVIDLHNEVLAV